MQDVVQTARCSAFREISFAKIPKGERVNLSIADARLWFLLSFSLLPFAQGVGALRTCGKCCSMCYEKCKTPTKVFKIEMNECNVFQNPQQKPQGI